MASSDNTCFVAHSATLLGDTYPVGSAIYHDVLDSARHGFDARAQVLVNYPARGTTQHLDAGGTTTTIWYPITTFAFHLSMRGDGQSFRVRVRVTASASAANTIAFRAVLSSPETAPGYARAAAVGANVLQASTSSTTAVNLTAGVLYLDASQARECIRDQRGYDATSAGSPVAVTICDATLSIWSKTTNAAATARIFAVHASEYYGPP